MGALNFSKGTFADHLHEIIGYKAGIAASVEHMCDLLIDTGYADDIRNSEAYGLRIRSEDYDDLYYKLLHKIGTTEEPYDGIFEVLKLGREFANDHGIAFSEDIFDLYKSGIDQQIQIAIKNGSKSLDPTDMINAAHLKYGNNGVSAMLRLIEENAKLQKLSPHANNRWCEWSDVLDLEDLFSQYQKRSTYGEHFDQRFIDFLSNNHDKLGSIHWRKFEELTGECFLKFGFNVEIGPGSNDDGVDVRVWNDNNSDTPKYIIQCKRQKSQINKVTVKGLYADVLEERAEMGLLVTTSEFSPGAKKTVSVRGYPIEEINGSKVAEWLNQLRTPGAGIVRV